VSRFRARARVTLPFAIVLVCLVAIAGTWSVVSHIIDDHRVQAIQSRLRENANLAKVLEEHAARILHNADVTLRFLTHEAERAGLDIDLRARLSEFGVKSEVYVQSGLIDERGDLISTTAPSTRRFNIADREHFRVHVANDKVGLFIGPPLVNRIAGQMTMQLSRRINKPDGRFGGVAAILLDPAYFAEFYLRLESGENDMIALIGRDQVIRAARIGQRTVFGDTYAEPELWNRMQSLATNAFVGTSADGGAAWLYSYRVLKDFPLAVVVRKAPPSADEIAESLEYMIGGWVLTLLILGTGLLSIRTVVRERNDALARAHSALRLTVANTELEKQLAANAVTQRQLSEQLDRVRIGEARNELLASIVEQGHDAVCARDLEGHIITWNAAAVAMFGYSAAEAIGQPVGTLHHANMSAAEAALVLERIRSGERIDVETQRTHRAGTAVDVWITTTPLLDSDGRRIGVVSLFRDIAEKKRLERVLRESAAAAEAANRAKSEFLANMSHEIRTPLNGILGMTELVLDSGLTIEQREQLSIALSSGRALVSVINDILDFSKIEAGQLDIDAIRFSPRESMTHVIRMFELATRAKGLQLRSRVSSDVPGGVVGDPGRLRQILVNLVGNAIKFTGSGSIDIELDAEAQIGSAVLLNFRVRDTGIGIRPDKLARVFEPFTQGDSTVQRRFGGTGLGLTISARLVRLMGGEIGVESVLNQGSTFHFSIRCRVSTASAADDDDSHPAGTPAQNSGGAAAIARSILLVEDNPVNQLVASTMIKRFGHHVSIANNGVEGINAIATGRFDMVLMDMQMPVMDGLEATAAIRARETITGGRMPIVALTANAMEGHRELCVAAGMDDYLVKPFEAGELRKVLLRWLPNDALPDPANTVNVER
jgi:PAS domain S-box-containing protein